MILNSKKIKELQSENEELKKLLEGFADKENRLKQFEELIKKSRIEYANITLKKNQTAQTLDVLENQKTKLNTELHKISSEIRELRDIKLSEQNQLLALESITASSKKFSEKSNNDNLEQAKNIIYKEIDSAEKRKNEVALETLKFRKRLDELNSKISEVNRIKNALTKEVERKKEEISILIGRKKAISQEQNDDITSALIRQNEEKLKFAEELQIKINQLRNQESVIIDHLSDKKSELKKLEKQIEEKNHLTVNESEINNSIKQLTFLEAKKKELLHELSIKIEAKEARLTSLDEDCKAKLWSLNNLKNENEELFEKINSGSDQLKHLTDSIEIATSRLSDLDYSLNVLDKEFNNLFQDIENKKHVKMELDSQIISRQGEKENLEDVIKELKETTSVLSQLKNDIESGSGQSAKRFTGIIQYYSSTINEMNIKKSALEKEIRRNIKTIFEKEQLIEEKQSSLEEMENMLNAGKSNFSLFEELMQFLGEQKKLLLINKNFIDEYSQDSAPITRNEITENKLTEFENALNDLLHSDTDYSTDLINRRIALEQEVEENNSVLNNLKEKISDSANDLSELRESVNKIKVEHEEHRVAINKLASMKQKLIEEINKQQIIVDKYSKIKEMIRQEQELIKLKRDFVTTQNLTNQSKTKEKIFDTHNPNWIKL